MRAKGSPFWVTRPFEGSPGLIFPITTNETRQSERPHWLGDEGLARRVSLFVPQMAKTRSATSLLY